MGDDDRSGYLDRDKKSYVELDRMRREGGAGKGGGGAPRNPREAAEAKRAADAALKQADGLFYGGKNAERESLARAVVDARGTGKLDEACRAYHAGAGLPADPRHISCFLDATAPDVLRLGLEAIGAARSGASLEMTAGLRTQLRMLADHSDDAVAEDAEALLEEV